MYYIYRQLPPQEPYLVPMANALFSILSRHFQSLVSCCPQPVPLSSCFLLYALISHEGFKERSPIFVNLHAFTASMLLCLHISTLGSLRQANKSVGILYISPM